MKHFHTDPKWGEFIETLIIALKNDVPGARALAQNLSLQLEQSVWGQKAEESQVAPEDNRATAARSRAAPRRMT